MNIKAKILTLTLTIDICVLTELVNNSFLIMVDPYRKQIYQQSTNGSSSLEGVPMSRTTQPISVDYDLTGQRMYWIEAGQAQGNAIHSATITGITETVVFDGSRTGALQFVCNMGM